MISLAGFKGTVPRDFRLRFLSWISFPQAPEYTNRAVSNFFENSRRYSQLKVHHRCRWHRWQMAKIFKLKNFNYFVWTPFGSRVNIYINFCLQVQFMIDCSLIIVPIICHRCHWHRWQICRRRRWYRWQKLDKMRCILSLAAITGSKSTLNTFLLRRESRFIRP